MFDHKLSAEEIQELVVNYDYDPKYLDPDYFDEDEPEQPIFDRFGNPTEATIRVFNEFKRNFKRAVTDSVHTPLLLGL